MKEYDIAVPIIKNPGWYDEHPIKHLIKEFYKDLETRPTVYQASKDLKEKGSDYRAFVEKNNIGVIIAGAGGSAHLPGMISALTHLPVLGVPIESKKLKGLDSLLSIVQMPKGIPVGTLAIGEDGAINAALLAASIIANNDSLVKKKLKNWKTTQTKSVKKKPK